MFERFTPRARRVIVVAQDTARDMGHAQIHPQHLLVALRQSEGLAAHAMTEVGVDPAGLHQRVASLFEARPAARKIDKVPFSAEAKKCMEQSLRAALALDHNYIGTEHLYFGVERQARSDRRSLDDLLGVSASDVHRRLTELLHDLRAGTGPGGTGAGTAMRSPAVRTALDRARAQAGQSAMTTGHLLAGILADADSQVSRALSALGVEAQQVREALEAVDTADTSDASPPAHSVAVTIDGTTRVIADPAVAAALKQLDTGQLRELLKRAAEAAPGPHPGQAAG